jgi:hypothetical protein
MDDTPQLGRIDTHARVSAASRSDETRAANGSRGFSTLLIGEDAAGRRRPHAPHEEPDAQTDPPVAEAVPETESDLVIEAQAPGENDEVLPEDAHDGQELCAFLAVPHA